MFPESLGRNSSRSPNRGRASFRNMGRSHGGIHPESSTESLKLLFAKEIFTPENDSKPHEVVRVSFEWVKGRKFFACWFLLQQRKQLMVENLFKKETPFFLQN